MTKFFNRSDKPISLELRGIHYQAKPFDFLEVPSQFQDVVSDLIMTGTPLRSISEHDYKRVERDVALMNDAANVDSKGRKRKTPLKEPYTIQQWFEQSKDY